MIKKIKNQIQKIFNLLGYEIIKLPKKVNKISPSTFKEVGGGANFDPDYILYHKYYDSESIKEKNFYNIGAGTFRHKYWKNIDLASDWYNESQIGSDMINYDLFSLKPLPIADSSAEVVYTSHTVEHINNKAAQNMFNEAHRILKPGGIFRITTPDIDLYYKACFNNDEDFFWWTELFSSDEVCKKINIYPFKNYSLVQRFLFSFSTHTSLIVKDTTIEKFSDEEIITIFKKNTYEDAFNIIISRCTIEIQRQYFGYHMNWWNWIKTKKMLEQAGFSEIYKSGFGQSVSPVMRDTILFDKQDPKESLYVEAVR